MHAATVLENAFDLLDIAKDEVNFFKRATLSFRIEPENDRAKSVCEDE